MRLREAHPSQPGNVRSGRKQTCAPDIWVRELLSVAVPRENLIEDDGAKGCGANPAHREVAELECEVAGPCGKRGCDGDQISRVGEIYLVLDPDPACHRGDQAKQHDRQAADAGTGDRENKRAEFWREAQQDRDDGSNDKQKGRIDLSAAITPMFSA